MSSSFEECGFLSQEFEDFKLHISQRYSENFAKVEDLSHATHKLLRDLPVENLTRDKVAAIVFLERSARACHAAVLLCKSGMIQEAQVLVRTAAETFFVGAALLADDSVFLKLAQSSDFEEAKQAEGMLEFPTYKMSEDHILVLNEVIARKSPGDKKYSTYDAAKAAGQLGMYQALYRGLSSIASHATFRSLDRSFVQDGENYAISMGPSEKDLAFTLGLIKRCLAGVTECVQQPELNPDND